MEVLSWILNIAIVVIAVFWVMISLDDARKKGYYDGFERGKKSAEDDAYERVGKTMENLLNQIEANEKEIFSLKSQLNNQSGTSDEIINNRPTPVNDLLFDLYRFNKKKLYQIDGIEEFTACNKIIINKNEGEFQNGMELVFKNRNWFVPFDKNIDSDINLDIIPKLVFSVYTENPNGERKNVTFNNPLSVYLAKPES